jgi:hypothetical protein
MLTNAKEFTVPDVPSESHLVVLSAYVTCREMSEYVRLSCVVPAGTVGGSVKSTAKEEFAEAFCTKLGLANKDTEMITIATITAAKL